MSIERDCYRGLSKGMDMALHISLSHFIMMELMARVVIIDSDRAQRTFKVPYRLLCLLYTVSLYMGKFSVIRVAMVEAVTDASTTLVLETSLAIHFRNSITT